MLLNCNNINCFHYSKYYFLNKILICMLKWFAGLLLGVSNNCLWCNVISSAKLFYMFSNDYHELKWEYSTIKQNETGRLKSSIKEQCQFFFRNYFTLLNNKVMINSVQFIFCWRANNKFSWSNFCFTVGKEFWYGKKYQIFLGEFLWILFFKKLLWILTPSLFEYYFEYYPEVLT